jgi:hypothetical protein
MNIRKTLILSLTAAAFAVPGISSAVSPQANSATSYLTSSESSKTRAEVINELKVARQNGSYVDNISRNYPMDTAATGSGKTRAQVIAELQTARQNGSLVTNVSRNYPTIQQFSASTKTRAEVQNEYLSMSAAEQKTRANLLRGG